jgi:leucine-rich repeat protein SHOC2
MGNLINLRVIFLQSNRLTELPEDIVRLTNLEALLLNNNQLKAFPAGIQNWKKLRELNLQNNLFETFPAELAMLEDNLQIFSFEGNPLSSIPQGFLQDKKYLFQYLRDLEAVETVPWKKLKLLFVGDGNVGKTTLLKVNF